MGKDAFTIVFPNVVILAANTIRAWTESAS